MPDTSTTDEVLIDVKPAPVQLVFENVSIEVATPRDKENPTKTILSKVSGIFGPSKFAHSSSHRCESVRANAALPTPARRRLV